LSGVTGEGRHFQTIDVGAARPSEKNAALRYLWARHRITILSDYNMLKPNDSRIKEVTDLGLTYHLLTAYTSFVAVDSEVRNKNGSSTAVKQPLPLPEGVSDYAVGNAGACKAMAPAMYRSASPASPAAEDATMQEAFVKKELKDKSGTVRQLSIRDIRVSGGLSRDEALKAVQSRLHEIEACVKNAGSGGLLELTLTVGADGTVKAARITKGSIGDKTARTCLLEAAKKWKFSPVRDGKPSTVLITLAL
jgi:Ca-activated chloride channel family protein